MTSTLFSSLTQRPKNKPPKYSIDGDIAFTLGNFTFHGTEIPESLEYVGGDQMVAVHNFPGGIRTVQTLGYFPAAVSWSGWLFSFAGQVPGLVATAFDRLTNLKYICNNGLPVVLNYGGISLQGIVNKFNARVVNQNQVRYNLEMVITNDTSDIVSNQNNVNQRQALQLWSNSIKNLQVNPSLPFDLSNPLDALQTGLQSLLLKYDSRAAADITNIINLASSVQAASSLLTGSSPDIESLAVQASALATGAATTASAGAPGVATVPSINPSLPTLASQFYGDASQWPTIATANALTDPQPLGEFSNLQIPAPPTTPPTG